MTINEKYIELLLPHFAAICEGVERLYGNLTVVSTSPVLSVQYRKNDSKKKQRCAAFLPPQRKFWLHLHLSQPGTSECINNMSFPNFLKAYNPPLYKQYHLEREVAGTTGKGHNIGSYFGGDK